MIGTDEDLRQRATAIAMAAGDDGYVEDLALQHLAHLAAEIERLRRGIQEYLDGNQEGRPEAHFLALLDKR